MLGTLLLKRKAPAAFDALGRHDVEALLANYADDVVFVYPGAVGPHGTHRGKPAVRALLERIFRQFPHIRFTVERVAVARCWDFLGDNVVYTHWDVDLENHEGLRSRLRGITVATLRRGKVVLLEDVFDASDEGHRRSWATEPATTDAP